MIMAWAIRRCVFERYAEFSGRSSRQEYWWYALAASLVTWPLALLAPLGADLMILAWLVSLPLAVPSLAALVRRLHDAGSSGWTLLALVIPILGALYVLILACSKSEPYDNRYGPVPVDEVPRHHFA